MRIICFKKKLPTIASVEAYSDDGFAIKLSNQHTIWLELSSRVSESKFKQLIESGSFHNPKTDGKCMYWEDGFSLDVKEILEMVMNNK